MFYIECQCRFRGVWNEVDNMPPVAGIHQALQLAAAISQQRRTPVRVVDDLGNVVWQSA
jgi:hypothetical protein